MKDELLDFDIWCKEHCTSALSKGISLAIENYRKSDNSSGLNETRAVRQNEQTKEFCSCPTDEGHSTNKRWCYDCNKPY